MSHERPVRAEDLETHDLDDGLIVFQPSNDRVHYLNPTAAVVYELCSGEHTEAEIAVLLGEAWELPVPPRDVVQGCLTQLREEGIVA